MLIYKVTNKINGKVYIGQTRKSLETRKRGHLRHAKQIPNKVRFHQALAKYGEDNFEWEVLCRTDTKQKLNELEIYYIKKYDSTNFDKGYNMVCGGDSNIMDYEEVRAKHDEKMRSEAVRQKISNTMKKRIADGNFFTEEHRKHLSGSAKGNHNFGTGDTRSVAVYCIYEGKRYDFHSIKEAGVWWYQTLRPIEHYSVCTYQRQLEYNIKHGYSLYGRGYKRHKIDNIKWYYTGGDDDEKVASVSEVCIDE